MFLLLQILLLVSGPGDGGEIVVDIDDIPSLGESCLVKPPVLDDGGMTVLLVLDKFLSVDWLPPGTEDAEMNSGLGY